MPSRWLTSAYFDRGMHTNGSQCRAVALTEMIRRFQPEERWDAVLLNCHDDYQGIISIDDILKYDLRLALEPLTATIQCGPRATTGVAARSVSCALKSNALIPQAAPIYVGRWGGTSSVA